MDGSFSMPRWSGIGQTMAGADLDDDLGDGLQPVVGHAFAVRVHPLLIAVGLAHDAARWRILSQGHVPV